MLVTTLGVVLELGKGAVEDTAAASVCPHCGSQRLAVRSLPLREPGRTGGTVDEVASMVEYR
jgi:hypothetical protein